MGWFCLLMAEWMLCCAASAFNHKQNEKEVNEMNLLEQYIFYMKQGDNIGLADLFHPHGVLHDSSLLKIGKDTLHLEGKTAIEMMFHYRFRFNRGPFKIQGVEYIGEQIINYFITYGETLLHVHAFFRKTDAEDQIQRLDIYPT